MPGAKILLEGLEDQSKSYDPSCDSRKDLSSYESMVLGTQRKARVLHYNPNTFKIGELSDFNSKEAKGAIHE